MKKILITLTVFSMTFAGTMYLGYDVDDSEILTMGYNHTVKHWTCDETGDPSWILAAGANFDINSDLMKFASFYVLPMKPVTKKMSLWMSFGYGFILDDGGFENLMDALLELQGIVATTELTTGLTYGLGIHYNFNEKMGFGLGNSVNTLDLELSAMGIDFDPDLDDLERTNIYFSYSF
tara:strand:- start:86 stop:622 length:537 start_codon:yes stop_codon:yes gene_type:complete